MARGNRACKIDSLLLRSQSKRSRVSLLAKPVPRKHWPIAYAGFTCMPDQSACS